MRILLGSNRQRRHCERSEAIHLLLTQGKMDCFGGYAASQ
jgi:hypothetical protein